MAEGFLGRWSQRKQAVRDGKPVTDAVDNTASKVSPAAPVATKPGLARTDPTRQRAVADARTAERSDPPACEPEQPAPPSMDDVAALNAESDFKPFVARAVAPEVRNAAMKKLFADPHFNVMDGLDIYIDDYSIPDPLPASMLRKMASAQFLKLFDEEEPAQLAPGARSVADTSPVVAQPEAAEPCVADTPDTTDTPGAANAPETGTSDIRTTEPDNPRAAPNQAEKTDPTV